jgi:hypothetical protein
MTLWGLIVAASVAIGFSLLFARLAIEVPIHVHCPGISTARSWNRRPKGSGGRGTLRAKLLSKA